MSSSTSSTTASTASCGLTSDDDIKLSKIIRLDANVLKQLNPKPSFAKHW